MGWFRRVHRRDEQYIAKRMLKLAAKRKEENKKRHMDGMKEDTMVVGMKESRLVGDRVRCSDL